MKYTPRDSPRDLCFKMDAPCDNVSELAELAGDHGDHTEWNLIVRALGQRLGAGKPAH